MPSQSCSSKRLDAFQSRRIRHHHVRPGLCPGPQGSGTYGGTTTQDGAHGAGSVFKLTRSGGGWTKIDPYDFPGGTQGAVPYGSVSIEANDNLYGTASQGGTHGFGVVREITT
jgi:hypothetical protein